MTPPWWFWVGIGSTVLFAVGMFLAGLTEEEDEDGSDDWPPYF